MSKFKVLIIALICTAAAAAAAPPPAYPPGGQDELSYGHLFEPQGRGPVLPSKASWNYDVRKYTITMTIDDENLTVDAKTTTRVRSKEASLTTFSLDFTTLLKVTRVARAGKALAFNHSNNLLTVTLDRPMAKGEDFDVDVEYNGKPGNGFFFTTGGVFTSTEMSYSRNWFPCKDRPADKAEDGVELYLTVRDDWYAASNGLLAWSGPAGEDTSLFHWVHSYPIATYLVAIACADYYRGFNQTWRGMPVNYYVYESQATVAPIFFEHQLDMLDCFAAKFGDYPFKAEKYGVAAVDMTSFGGMENQTCTFIRASYIGAHHNGDHLLAHELAHSWWGDMVTCGTWKDLWLNEGQATYSDALYTEYRDGDAAFRERMEAYAEYYFREDASRRFSVYDPKYPWSATVYEKGAWVLHMLRRLMGDAEFYRAWNDYGAAHKYGTAVTDDLQDEFETVYGADLDWFFEQWVYKAGYPEFKYSWVKSGDGKTVKVKIEQVQEVTSLTPLFKCPVDLTFAGRGDGEYTKTVWVAGREHNFEFNLPEEIYWVYFDKDVWLLQKNTCNIGIVLEYFRARPAERSVALAWATSAEKDFAGFNLYRGSDAGHDEGRVKLNANLITGRSPYTFVDGDVEPNKSYRYWLEAVDLSGGAETFGPAEVRLPTKPVAFALHQNAPNPTRGRTTLAFSLAAAGPASLAVYDLAGREVWRREGTFAEGANELEAAFDLAPGVYVYRLTAGSEAAAKKMVVVE
jgi:aminopeptidase N